MRNQKILYAKWVVILPLLALCGCSSLALHQDYDNYSETYGDAFNKQLLLNLARESRQEPAYFLQLASISSQYQFSTAAGFTPSATRTDPASIANVGGMLQHTLTLGGSLTAGATQTPVFQFLPLTGSNFVQAVLTPISDKVFWTFYDEGWPVDWVGRVMISSIEQETIETNKQSDGNNITKWDVYANDPTDPTYPKFLQCCNDFKNAQLFHILYVDKTVGKTVGDVPLIFSNKTASLKEIVSAVQAGLSVKYETNMNYVITKEGDTVNLMVSTNQQGLMQYFYYTNGTEAEISYSNAVNFAMDLTNRQIKFTTRTFEEALNGVADEEDDFDDYTNPDNSVISHMTIKSGYASVADVHADPYGTFINVHPDNNDGEFSARPILMIKYKLQEFTNFTKIVQEGYKGAMYTIGDLNDTNSDIPLATYGKFIDSSGFDNQNGTVFTMISYLFSQTAINTQDLPVQQLIQVQ